MSHGSEDLDTHPLDAFNNALTLSSVSGESNTGERSETSVSQEPPSAKSFPRAERFPTASETLTAPSEGHVLGVNRGLEDSPGEAEKQDRRRYPVEWGRGITPQDNGEGASNAAGARDVSKWSSSSDSTAAESWPSPCSTETEELVEALASTAEVSPRVIDEPAVPEVQPIDPKKERHMRTEYAKVRTKYYWRRVKALQKRAATFLGDMMFYGIFGAPVRDPMVVNAEVIDGISVTESELREYQAAFINSRSASSIPAPSASDPPAPEEQQTTAAPQGERKTRSRVSSQVRKIGRKVINVVKNIGKKRN
ncbi:hypothetical protein PISL3812_03337 [Talaromyces islandicus]|uniref:Uncharacterized protein n=1 Tax=Talaromyces islandicus TaxID=28573 RepID=A0A0U1LTA4_TALIS|nr:hypothetical protein PISL3812_03337 [Talaromyces islandicus]